MKSMRPGTIAAIILAIAAVCVLAYSLAITPQMDSGVPEKRLQAADSRSTAGQSRQAKAVAGGLQCSAGFDAAMSKSHEPFYGFDVGGDGQYSFSDDSTAFRIEHSLAIGERHIAEQEERILQQQDLVLKLKSEGHAALADNARDVLADMVVLLAQMRRDVALARRRLQSMAAVPDA